MLELRQLDLSDRSLARPVDFNFLRCLLSAVARVRAHRTQILQLLFLDGFLTLHNADGLVILTFLANRIITAEQRVQLGILYG